MKGSTSDVKQRTVTGILMAFAVCAILMLSHVHWVLQGVVAVLSFMGLRELYRALKIDGTKGIVLLSMTLAVNLAFLPSHIYFRVISVFFPVYVILCLYSMLFVKKSSAIATFSGIVLGICITLSFRAVTELRTMDQGFYLLTASILICALTDVGAYFVGRRFGKRKLAPKVSPRKTVAGCVGGTVISVLVMLLAAVILDRCGILHVQFGKLTIYLVLTSLAGQFGDLGLSAVKRICGIKDFASYFPGHGGVLDRCDSHLAALPFTYLYVSYAGTFLS